MAQVPFAHIEAPGKVYIGGTLAYATGDPIPVDVAARYGIEGEVLEGVPAPDADATFADVAVVIGDDGKEIPTRRPTADGDGDKDPDAGTDAGDADDAAQAAAAGAPPATPPAPATRPRVTPPKKEQ